MTGIFTSMPLIKGETMLLFSLLENNQNIIFCKTYIFMRFLANRWKCTLHMITKHLTISTSSSLHEDIMSTYGKQNYNLVGKKV